jgi:hypothetical protein
MEPLWRTDGRPRARREATEMRRTRRRTTQSPGPACGTEAQARQQGRRATLESKARSVGAASSMLPESPTRPRPSRLPRAWAAGRAHPTTARTARGLAPTPGAFAGKRRRSPTERPAGPAAATRVGTCAAPANASSATRGATARTRTPPASRRVTAAARVSPSARSAETSRTGRRAGPGFIATAAIARHVKSAPPARQPATRATWARSPSAWAAWPRARIRIPTRPRELRVSPPEERPEYATGAAAAWRARRARSVARAAACARWACSHAPVGRRARTPCRSTRANPAGPARSVTTARARRATLLRAARDVATATGASRRRLPRSAARARGAPHAKRARHQARASLLGGNRLR